MNELKFYKAALVGKLPLFDSFNYQHEDGKDLNMMVKVFRDYREKFINCNTVDELKDQCLSLGSDVKNMYESLDNAKDRPFLTRKYNEFMGNCGLTLVDEKFDSIKKYYEEKTSFDGKLAPEVVDFIRIYEQDAETSIEQIEKARERSYELINKYGLKSIEISGLNLHTAWHYLGALDHSLEKVCDKLSIKENYFGQNNSLTYGVTDVGGYYAYSIDKIALSLGSVAQPEVSLHEWIHSLDYKIGNHFVPGKFATQIEQSVIDDGSPMYESFKKIKSIVQKFTNLNAEKIEEAKYDSLQTGSSKFLHEIIGDDIYAISEPNRIILRSPETTRLINNYLTDPKSETNQKQLEDLLKAVGVANEKVLGKIENPNDSLLELKSYFDKVNENYHGLRSFYFVASYLSRGPKLLENIKEFIRSPGIRRMNSHNNIDSNDYFVQPVEMFARYAEKQIFPEEIRQLSRDYLRKGMAPYEAKKDDDFKEKIVKVIEGSLGKDAIKDRISSIRAKSNYDAVLDATKLSIPSLKK